MPGFRDEVRILPCGCKIGRSKGGLWFYDYLCEIHVGMVYDGEGHYSLELAEDLTQQLNQIMKRKSCFTCKKLDKCERQIRKMASAEELTSIVCLEWERI